MSASNPSSTQNPPARPSGVMVILSLKHPDPAPANFAKLMAALAKIRTLSASLDDPGRMRLFLSRFSGTETGTFLVTVEYASLHSMGDVYARVQGSKEWQEAITELKASGFQAVSESLVTEEAF